MVSGWSRRWSSTASALVVLAVSFTLVDRAPAHAAVAIRGAYGTPATDIQAAGFNTVNAAPSRSTLDDLAARGLKAVVWLGNYSNSTCTFSKSDTSLIADVQAIAGHPAIAAWQISDEPKATKCPAAAQHHSARTALIHTYDARPTYTVISTWDGEDDYPYQKFAGATDIMGLDVYPCRYNSTTCSFGMIDKAIASADAAGVARYWAVLQTFGDGYYRMPTASELSEILRRWSASRMQGYFAYHWNQQGSFMVDWLARHADVVSVMRSFNAGMSVPDTRPPTRPRYPHARWVGRSVRLWWHASRDNVGVAWYRIFRDGRYIGRTRSLSYYARSHVGKPHRFAIRAVDFAGNGSSYSWVSIGRKP